MNIETYTTKYGDISLYSNEIYIGQSFKDGKYWDEDTLIQLKSYIDPDKNILEIGGHCGTSSIVYASFLNEGSKVYVYEPQKKLYDLLCKNIEQNQLTHKIIPFHTGVFCYDGDGFMNDIDLDGGGGNLQKRYEEESNLQCNFGGACIGQKGENIRMITVDNMNLDNIGFIHCDAQGSENFIFSAAINTIKRDRPVIYYENNVSNGGLYLYYTVCMNYQQYIQSNGLFNVEDYCLRTLNYSRVFQRFNNGMDDLLIP